MKKRPWIIRRHTIEAGDAQQRWDRAYHSLVQWSARSLEQQTRDGRGPARMRQEEAYEDCNVCASVHPTTSTNPNH